MPPRFLLFAVVGLLVSLQALAYASPPDQSWIGGLYDDADYDDVVILVTSTAGTAETARPCAFEPYWTPVWLVVEADDRLVPGPTPSSHRPRGPPRS
jgi:hypothetical protein